jgi:hypothetical protein
MKNYNFQSTEMMPQEMVLALGYYMLGYYYRMCWYHSVVYEKFPRASTALCGTKQKTFKRQHFLTLR